MNEDSGLSGLILTDQEHTYVSIQRMLSDITNESIDQVYQYIISNIPMEKIGYIANEICRFAKLRPTKMLEYAQLCVLLNQSHKDQIYYSLTQEAKGPFLRFLFEAKIIDIQRIKIICQLEPYNAYCFIPELGINHTFMQDFPNALYKSFINDIEIYRKNSWEKYFEIIKFEYASDTIQACIKNDDIEKLISFSTLADFNSETSFVTSPFSLQTLCRMSYLGLAAFSQSIKSFKYLLLNGAKLTDDVCTLAIKGGSLEIVRLCDQHGGNFENGLYAAIEYFQHDIFDWLLFSKKCIFPDANISLYGNVEAFLYIMQHTPNWIDYKDEDDDTPLHAAAMSGSSLLCEIILSKSNGELKHIENQKHQTPTDVAKINRHLIAARILM